jgi:glutamate-1-semialdehyde 2,1-aminomutase
LATLSALGPETYEKLARITEKLASGLRSEAADAGVPVQVASDCGLLTVFFTEAPVCDYEAARAADASAYARFFQAMLERSVYLPPSAFEAWFPSLAHTDAQLEHTIEAAREAFAVAGSTR